MIETRESRRRSTTTTAAAPTTKPPRSAARKSGVAPPKSPIVERRQRCANDDDERCYYSVEVSARFLFFAVAFAVAVATFVGTACRHAIVVVVSGPPDVVAVRYSNPDATIAGIRRSISTIDAPAFAAAFATKLFRGRRRADDRSDAPPRDRDEEEDDEDEPELDGSGGGFLHQPSAPHLLVNIRHVDPDFLDSEERITGAMFDLVEGECRAALLSHSCHSFPPPRRGLNCVGVASDSRVAVRTWPREGVLVADLHGCGARDLVPSLAVVEGLFAVPIQRRRRDEGGQGLGLEEPPPSAPETIWSHKLRGFRNGFGSYRPYENPLDQDLGADISSSRARWTPLISVETEFQTVDVLESHHPYDSRGSDKTLYLDGVQQSSLRGEAAYHEALVHPAMLAHPNPRRVAIVGGGEGATLREALKHVSVEEAFMIEIDGELVGLCREHLPEWSDCSDVRGSDADSCFDDSRATVVFDDAFRWFIDRFGSDGRRGSDGEEEEEKMDVIIMDALDPDRLVEIVGSLYKDNKFVESIFNGLSDDGVFVVQIGESFASSDAAYEAGPYKDTSNMMEGLESAGFESMHIYYEAHSHFSAPWAYLVCFKDSKSRANWYKSPAEIEIELHRRLHGTKSGKPVLLFFDPSTMVGYQTPSKAEEIVYCRKEITPRECHEARSLSAGTQHRFEEENPRRRDTQFPNRVYSPVLERHSLRTSMTVGMNDVENSSAIAGLLFEMQATIGM